MEAQEVLSRLLREMVRRGASDMHIRAAKPPMLRILGELLPLKLSRPITPKETREMALFLMSEQQWSLFEKNMEVDLSSTIEGVGRFRGNVYHQRGNINLALRVIPTVMPSIEGLNLPPVLKTLAEKPRGLVLVTGTTGCGKSTTLAAMINHINANRSAHIVTIEDPIEFEHLDNKSIVSQRELKSDTSTFAEALRTVVRQDPDVILVGEMRDLETIATAISAAQTGHLVFSTIHTVDTIQTITRIVDLYPPHQHAQIRLQLAETLMGVISQRLLKRSDISARIPAVEILVNTPMVKKSIEENDLDDVRKAMRKGEFYGMQTFNRALLDLYREGKVRLDDALECATNPDELMLAVRGIEAGAASGGGEDTKIVFEE